MSIEPSQKRKLVPLLPNTLLKKHKSITPSVATNTTISHQQLQQLPQQLQQQQQQQPIQKFNKQHIPSNFQNSVVSTKYRSPEIQLKQDDPEAGDSNTESKPQVTTTIINKNPPNYYDQPKPRHLKSCSRCRKHKTKCNYIDTQPNPCTSCSKRGLTCQLEIVIPVKRSNIIKNLSDNIDDLKDIVDSLVLKDRYLKQLCKDQGIQVDGLVDVECSTELYCHEDFKSPVVDPSYITYTTEHETLTPPESITPCSDYGNIMIKMPELPVIEDSHDNNEEEEEEEEDDDDSSLGNNRGNLTTPPTSEDEEQQYELQLLENKFGVKDEPLQDDNIPIAEEESSFEIESTDIKYQLIDALTLMDQFNSIYLPFIPIMDKIRSPTVLYKNSKLLFWTIIYITSQNTNIFKKFIKNELIKLTWLQTPNQLAIIQSILILCSFPIKFEINPNDSISMNELDTSLFQWLQLAKDLSLQIGLNRSCKFVGEFSRRVQKQSNNMKNKFRYNIWCFIFILGTIYGFKLGIKWDSNLDYILELKRDEKSYLGKLLSITILSSKALDQLVYDYKNLDGLTENKQLLANSLTSWRYQLSILQKDEFLNSSSTATQLSILLDQLEITFLLFEPIEEEDEPFERILINDKLYTACQIMFDKIDELNVIESPIYIKINLEFISLILLKLSYSPFNNCKCEQIWEFFTKVFKKLLILREYKDALVIIQKLASFNNSVVKFDTRIVEFQTMFNSFKSCLLTGYLHDFQSCVKKISHEGQENGDDDLKLRELLNRQSMDVEKSIKDMDYMISKSGELFNMLFAKEKQQLLELEQQSSNAATIVGDGTGTGTGTGNGTGLVEFSDRQLDLTIDNLVNGDVIDVLQRSQEENLNALNSLLKGIDWVEN